MKKCVSFFSIRLLLALVCVALLGPVAAAQTTPTPGQNVNIVSGPAVICPPPPGTPLALAQLCPQWQTIIGDPFLQRQNEPSLAVSTVNPLHLLAGANDYRAVDVPLLDVLPGSMAGDAWCGWFYSPDGGQSWQSTLLPGFPQDRKSVV